MVGIENKARTRQVGRTCIVVARYCWRSIDGVLEVAVCGVGVPMVSGVGDGAFV